MNPKMIRSMKAFTRTVELKSMSAAASELHMTVSAVSQQLRKLEKDNGLALFHRNTRVMTLTEAGEVFYQSCLDILSIAAKNQERMEQLTQTPAGVMKIMAPVGFGGGLLSEPLRQLTEQFPDMQFKLSMTDEPIDLVTAGVDLAIRIGPLPDSSLYSHHLINWHLVPCVASTHELAKRRVSSLEDLQAETFIAHFSNTYDLPLPAPRIQVDNMQTTVQLTCDGVGFALLPEPEVKPQLQNGELVRLLHDWEGVEYGVYAVLPVKESIPAKTRLVMNVIEDWFKQV